MRGCLVVLAVVLSASLGEATTCGKRFRHQDLVGIRQWIVGGVDATKGAYPWQISYQWVTKNSGNLHMCGGTIISPSWIVTAAHCIDPGMIKYFKFLVVGGEHNLEKEEGSEQIRDIAETIVHPNYNTETNQNDIALLKLSTPLRFDSFVQSACLPKSKSLYAPGTEAIISGWGEIDPKGIFNKEPGRDTPTLKAAGVPLVDKEVCNGRGKYHGMLKEGMFCAGFLEGGVDGCQGDSGGPLVVEDDGHVTLLGVTSWGMGCAQKNKPGVYTVVADFVPWISRVTGVH